MSNNFKDQYDLQNAISKNRFNGLWRMLSGYRWNYVGATVSMAFAATAKTVTYLMLAYFIDTVLGENFNMRQLALMALLFVGLATLEGLATFNAGRLANYTAESVTRRLRNYLYDHIQRLTFS